ncbi:hypothetical protein VIBC2010_02606 [Vibrio caribbeanicus ATCC BAA-2122]|uniref:Uncharacterized protein n=2 Tax=Vibrio caribbeanicus TaxID=701175 RepID=E3BPZ7_9VIBR|nr:hypothetical protein VIBC2010_02606 [Vibrio caribbeanicus ATCC BAA-2122]
MKLSFLKVAVLSVCLTCTSPAFANYPLKTCLQGAIETAKSAWSDTWETDPDDGIFRPARQLMILGMLSEKLDSFFGEDMSTFISEASKTIEPLIVREYPDTVLEELEKVVFPIAGTCSAYFYTDF